MYKLKNSYIDRMIDARISRSELAFILHIAQSQDDYGVVHSVYYKDICSEIDISIQKFYDILVSLTRKRLIYYEKANAVDIKVHLIGNDFSDGQFGDGYVNVAEKDFRRASFTKMKAGSQLIYLFSQRFTKGKHMLLENFYKEFCDKFHIKHKTLQLYIQELKERKFLFVSKKRNKAYRYEMTMQRSHCLDKRDGIPREKEGYISNIKKLIRTNFGRYLSNEDEKGVSDIAELAEQQRAVGYKDFPSLIVDSIRKSFEQQRQEKRKRPTLNAALVNKLLTMKITGVEAAAIL